MHINNNWKTAGSIAKEVQMLTASEAAGQRSDQTFYFANTPIRNGEAWVFPVGLSDAVWHATRGKNITVRQVVSVDEACNVTNTTMHEKIFLFTKKYAITDVTAQCNE